jgi:hypothetical protein
MMQNVLWKADSHSDCQTIACFIYGTRRFITVFTKTRHWTLSWASRIQFAPSIPISLRSNLMLSSPLRLVFLVDSSLRSSQKKKKTWKHLSPPRAGHMSRPPHPPWFNLPNNIRWRIQTVKFIIMQRYDPKLNCRSSNTKLKVKLSLCFNWAPRQEVVLGEWRYSSMHSWPRH